MKYYILNQQQVDTIIEANKNTEFITTICDYGSGPCISEVDVTSEGREYLIGLVSGQTPVTIEPQKNKFLPVDPD